MSNATPSFVDIYRTDDSLLIHERPGGWYRGSALFFLFLGIICGGFFTFLAIGSYLQPEPPTWSQQIVFYTIGWCPFAAALGCIYIGFYLAFVEATILVDRDTIRVDWWFFGGKGSKIYARSDRTRVEPIPGDGSTGKAGIAFPAGKTWYGTRMIVSQFQSVHDRKRILGAIDCFFNDVPANPWNPEDIPVRKGRSSDADFGTNLLASFSRNGKTFRKIEPEELTPSLYEEEAEQNLQSGVMYLRCSQCDHVLPRDQVDVETPLAHCPSCDCVFAPEEFAQNPPGKQRRVEIRNELVGTLNEYLEIVQKPQRTGTPLYTILSVFLFDLCLLGIYLYIQRLFPGENPLDVLRSQENPDVFIGRRLIWPVIIYNVLLLFLPFWTFFDRRTIRIDARKMEMSVRWLFFRWKKTVSRTVVRKVSFKPLVHMFGNVMILYGKRHFFLLGCVPEQEMSWCGNEINRFLYRVTPQTQSNSPVEPVILGGLASEDSVPVNVYCKACGKIIETEFVNIPERTVFCKTCENTFPLGQTFSCEKVEDGAVAFPPEHVVVEENHVQLTIRNGSGFTPGARRVHIFASIFIIAFFVGMMLLLMGALIWGDEFRGNVSKMIFFVIFVFPLSLGIVLITLQFMCEIASHYGTWELRLDSEKLELTLRYHTWKKWCRFAKTDKTVVIPRSEILQVCPNYREQYASIFQSLGLFGKTPESMESRRSGGSHLLLENGTKYYLPSVTEGNSGVNARLKMRGIRNGVISAINRFLAMHPANDG